MSTHRRVRKAVIPVAGRGTRQLPATVVIPKALMPLMDRDGLPKPIADFLLQEASSAGIEEVAFVVSPGQADSLRKYFKALTPELLAAVAGRPELLAVSDQLERWGRQITYIEQASPEGFGHAVWCARDWVGDEPFLVMLGDYLFVSHQEHSCAWQVVEAFHCHRPAAISGMFACDAETLSRVGVMRGDPIAGAPGLFESQLIVEKPSLEQARRDMITPGLPPERWLAHFGNYVFSADIMQRLDEMVRQNTRQRGEIQLTAAQESLRAAGGRHLALLIDGQAYDAGIPTGWLQVQEVLLQVPDLKRAHVRLV